MTLEEKIKNLFPIEDIFLLKINILPGKKIILTIGKKKGATLYDCEKISKFIHPLIGNEYYLQVQSSGIGWEIDTECQNSKIFIGEKIKITYLKDGKIKTNKGILKALNSEFVEILVNNESLKILKNNIKKIKTTF